MLCHTKIYSPFLLLHPLTVHMLMLCKGSMFIDKPEGDFSTSASSQIHILLKQFLPITLYLTLLTNKTNTQFFVPESSDINPVDKRKLHSSHRWADTKHPLNEQQIPFPFQLLFKKHLPEYTHIRIKHLQNHPWATSKLLLSYKKYCSLIAVNIKTNGSSAKL